MTDAEVRHAVCRAAGDGCQFRPRVPGDRAQAALALVPAAAEAAWVNKRRAVWRTRTSGSQGCSPSTAPATRTTACRSTRRRASAAARSRPRAAQSPTTHVATATAAPTQAGSGACGCTPAVLRRHPRAAILAPAPTSPSARLLCACCRSRYAAARRSSATRATPASARGRRGRPMPTHNGPTRPEPERQCAITRILSRQSCQTVESLRVCAACLAGVSLSACA